MSYLRILIVCSCVVGTADLAAADTNNQNAGGTFFGKIPDPNRTRRYYIAAESDLWDYAPEGQDVICGEPLRSPLKENRKAVKYRYFAYTDSTFSARAKSEPSLGILGPVLRGVVGDYLVVTFLNRTSARLSMHPHGVKYDKESEGAFYLPNPGAGGAVAPGESFTYVWFLDENSGPLPSEPSSKAWLYHSHVQGDQEINLGLIGTIIVTDAVRARPDGTPKDVDREFATLFMIFNENPDAAREKEAAEHGGSTKPGRSWAELQQLVEQGERYSINGRVFGNLSGLEMNEGERVRWYLFALGSEQDLHSAHWHGLRVLEDGRRRTDVVELMPGSMKVADLTADNPGAWLFHCHVAEHMKQGMFARMMVHPRTATAEKRAPIPGFLGIAHNLASLQIRTAEQVVATSSGPSELKLTGTVTVYEAFSVFGQPIRIQVGKKSVTLAPDERGVANSKDAIFRVVSDHKEGVVHGGLLDFEIGLRGAEWLAEIKKAAAARENSALKDGVPIEITVGDVRHTAAIPVEQILKADLSRQ